MIEVKKNKLVISFPEVHEDAKGGIEFQRTLRIPDDNQSYSLPPGLGRFPLHHVDDFESKLPERWIHHGGVFFSMYQAEAMWINFDGRYPMAIKIAAGKINAVTGKDWNNDLHQSPQDYVVTPRQPWLDGYNISEGMIRQFVAMPLGDGYTAEEQLTGEAIFGGLQVIVYPMKAERYEQMLEKQKMRSRMAKKKLSKSNCMMESTMCSESLDMGLAAGGLMKQEIYDDEYGIDAWDMSNSSRCYIHIANSHQYQSITGKKATNLPPTAKDYTDAGLPWFEHYNENAKVLAGSTELAGLDSVAAKGIKKGETPLPENKSVTPKVVISIPEKKSEVRDGIF